MSDIVLVAFISASGTLAAAFIGQFVATRAARRQADHLAQLEELKWQRSEAKNQREARDARLREFWILVLTTRNRLHSLLALADRPKGEGRAPVAESAASSAAEAYAVALLGIDVELPLAREFYHATQRFQDALDERSVELGVKPVEAWQKVFEALETSLNKIS
ncbi:hypothetical protein [Burkholderia gladioli]|uniref:hypothetical protein n=1 Tax=Burkholderia gladioli TaxID=28095 RepID=UPI0016406058|nr:hypothetical protein [Burkholderia gladioli]